MDHHFRLGAQGVLDEPDLDDKYYYGRRPTGFYIPRYRNLVGERREYLRGFGYQGSASRQGWQRGIAELGVGGDFKDGLTEPGAWTIGATAFGEMLPQHRNRITLDTGRAPTSGDCRCWLSTARSVRTSDRCARGHGQRHGRDA